MRLWIRRIVLTLAIVLASSVAAEAVTILVTPTVFVYGQKYVTCTVTNFDIRTVSVVAQQFDANALFMSPIGDSCNIAQLASGHTCTTTVDSPQSALCRFEVSSTKVKATLQVRDKVTGEAVMVIPAAKP